MNKVNRKKMGKNKYSRRVFIGKCLGMSPLIAGGVLVLNGCGTNDQNKKDRDNNVTSGSCDDLSGVSQEEIEKRKKFGYVKKTTVPGSHCGNCRLYIPGEAGQKCGGCLLFKGPVDPEGYCTQYEAQG